MLDESSIKFPVYKIGAHLQLEIVEDVALIETVSKWYILDDRALEGDLAQRRVKLKDELTNDYSQPDIYPLLHRYETFGQLLKDRKGSPGDTKYIDSNGNIFKYTPKKMTPVTYKKVKKQRIVEGRYTLLYLEDDRIPVKIPRPIKDISELYCGVLYAPTGREVLEFTYDKNKKSRKKV